MKQVILFFLLTSSICVFGQDSINQIEIESITNLNGIIDMVSEHIEELPKGEGVIGWFSWILSACAIVFNILVWLGVARYYKNKNV